MQIVTDSGTDLWFSPEQRARFNVHIVPMVVTLDGISYRENVDIQHNEFYDLLDATDGLPVTSPPSPDTFAETYRELAKKDPDILSIHLTSGLSKTYHFAITGADMVPEANVIHVDTKTLTAAAGWQVEAAARALNAGWPIPNILELMARIGKASESIYTVNELKYLIHGGRISHMKGLVATFLNIKPLIGVEKENGTYEERGQAHSFGRALDGLVKEITKRYQEGTQLQTQVLHSCNPEGAKLLRRKVDRFFDCSWLPIGQMSLVLGAHTGRSMVGVVFAPKAVFDEIP